MQEKNLKFKLIILISLIIFFLSPISAYAKTPNDPFYEQWGFKDVGVYSAWDYTTGSSDVVVAVIDNGFDTFHPDLRDNVWVNEGEIANNGVDDDHNGYTDDIHGWNFLDNDNDSRPSTIGLSDNEKKEGIFSHGTVVAGIIGASGNNGREGAGINWHVKLMNLKVIGNDGTGELAPLANAIYYAVDNGADVVNISMVGSGEQENIDRAILYAYGKGVVVVSAAGNNMFDLNTYPMYPVCSDGASGYEQIIGVSAINYEHYLAQFSNIGSKCIDVTAPGVNINSTILYSPSDGLLETYGTGWNGTSFSTPFVSGAAALIKSIQPNWKAVDIYSAILKNVHHTPSQDEVAYANLFGAGLLQIDKAVKYASEQLGNSFPSQNQNTIPKMPTTNNSASSLAHKLLFFAPLDGTFEKRTFGVYDEIPTGSKQVLVDIDDIERYIDTDGAIRYATTYRLSETERGIAIYTEFWRKMYEWRVESTGPLSISVGDIIGDDEPEVIVAPYTTHKTALLVFSTKGRGIDSYIFDTTHYGASIVNIANTASGKDDIGLAYIKDDGNTYVEILNGYFEKQKEFTIQNFNGAFMSAGDVTGDGVAEYVFGTREGKTAHVQVYTSDGKELSNFHAYGPQFKAGIRIAIADYDNNGISDIIVVPQGSGQAIRQYSYKGESQGSWWPFGSREKGRILVEALY
ncbi:MAG: S8 family serine peptidase [Candidatus Magasanikbacteria bacterium]